MRAWVEKYETTTAESLMVGLTVDKEIVGVADLEIMGTLEWSDGSQFFIRYFIDDLQIGISRTVSFLDLQTKIKAYNFKIGQNNLIIKVYDSVGNLKVTLTKLIWRNYYDCLYTVEGRKFKMMNVDFDFANGRVVYLGLRQESLHLILSKLELKFNVRASGMVQIAPIYQPWEPSTGEIPEVHEPLEITLNNVTSDTIISLLNFTKAEKPLYGIRIKSSNLKILFTFDRAEQEYHTAFLYRPKYVEYDHVIVSWDNLSLRYLDMLEKFVLKRDGTEIFTTTDYNIKEYRDENVQLGKTYKYVLEIWIKIPDTKYWQFKADVEAAWNKVTEDPELFQFYTSYAGFRQLPIDIYAALQTEDPLIEILDEGKTAQLDVDGLELFKEYYVEGYLEFRNRIAITRLESENSMTQNMITFVDDRKERKLLGQGFYDKFDVRKRVRDLDVLINYNS